jgi:hypothetical protein
MAKNFRRQGIRSKVNGQPNPLHPHDGGRLTRSRPANTPLLWSMIPMSRAGKLSTLRQLRNDPLARLHSHRQIDDAQFAAGRAFQNDREIAERGPRRSILPRKPLTAGSRQKPSRIARSRPGSA